MSYKKKQKIEEFQAMHNQANQAFSVTDRNDGSDDVVFSFVRDSQDYIRESSDAFKRMNWMEAMDTGKAETRAKIRDTFLERESQVRSFMENNKDEIDPDRYQQIMDYLDSFNSDLETVAKEYKGYEDYFSQWESYADYQDYENQQRDYEEKSKFDIAAGEKEIVHLERILEEYKSLTRFMTDEEGEARAETIRQQYGDEKGIKALISQKKQYLNQARHIQDGITLAGVTDRESENYDPDFETKSKYLSTIEGTAAGDTQYEWINNINGFRDDYESRMAEQALADNLTTGGYGAPSESYYRQNGYDKMTSSEVAIYNYYYTTEGKEKAQEYLDSITESLRHRKATSMFEEELEDRTGLEMIFGVSAGLDQFKSGVENLFNTEDSYIPQSAVQMASAMVREDLADKGAKLPEWMGGASLGQAGYDLITTSANMAPSIMTSMAVGLVNPVAGEIVGTGLMGASAAGNAYQEMLNLGYDKEQARMYSTLVGGAEASMQYLLGGIGTLGGKVSGNVLTKMMNGVDNAFFRTALKLAGNMASEGLEEGIQEILTPWFQNLVMHTDEDVNWGEVAYSTLLGALTAGVMEGGSTVSGEVNTYRTGRQLQKADISAQRLAEIGNTFAADTVAHQLAGRVNENTGAYTMGRLFNEIGATLTEQNVNDITEALVNKGMSREVARANAEAMASVVEGGNHTDAQVKIIEANEVLAEAVRTTIIDSNATWFQRTKGYNEALMALAKEKASPKDSRTNPAQQSEDNASASDTMDTKNKNGAEGSSEAGIPAPKVNKISTIKDGRMTVKLEDDSEIDVREAGIDPDDGVIIETIAQIDGISSQDANFILGTLKASPGASAQMNALGAKEMYKYGFYGISQDHIAKHGVFANSLTDSQRKAIYETGRQARQQQVDNKNATVAKKNATTEESGRVHFEGDRNSLTERQSASLTAMEKVAEILGVQIHVFESKVDANGKRIGANGWYDSKDSSIHIDLHAGVNGEGTMLFTVAHELTHHIRNWSPAKFKVLADFLMQEYGKKGVNVDALIRKQMAKAKRDGRTISYDTAYEEVVADSMETMLSDGNVLEKLAKLKQKDQSLWKKIKDFISELAAKIRMVYEGLTPDSIEGRYVSDMKDAIEHLQDLFVDGLMDATDNYRPGYQSNFAQSIKQTEKTLEVTETATETETEKLQPVSQNMETEMAVVAAEQKETLQHTEQFPEESSAQENDDSYKDADTDEETTSPAMEEAHDSEPEKDDITLDIEQKIRDAEEEVARLEEAYNQILRDVTREYKEEKIGGAYYAVSAHYSPKVKAAERTLDNSKRKLEKLRKDLTDHVFALENGITDAVELEISKQIRDLEAEYNKLSKSNAKVYMAKAKEAERRLNGLRDDLGRYLKAREKGETIRHWSEFKPPKADLGTMHQSDLTPGQEGVAANRNGDPVAYSTKEGSVLLSMRTYEEDGRKTFRDYLQKCVSSNKLTKAEMQEMLAGIEDIYQTCKEFKDKYAPFSSWSDAAVVRDTYGKPVFSVVTPNGDYKMNLDFSLVCKKRRTLDAVFNEMSRRGIIDDFELGQKSVVKINEIIRNHGLETACALCFVDAKRFRQASMADQFTSLYNELVLSLVPEDQKGSIDHFNFSGYETIKKVDGGIHTWNASKLDFSHLDDVMKKYGKGTVEHKAAKYIKSHPEGRKLLLRGDFMSSQGFDAVKTQNKDILKLYNSKKGTGGPKAAFGDVQYMNEIVKKARTWTPAKAYAVGGVRIQSFSDYVPRMVFDYVQMIYDLAATKLPAHAYTKEALFVKQFGLTGVKINMSLIPAIADGGIAPGLDANGDYVWAGESFDYETAKDIQNAEGYTENCGTICVGVSYEHIKKLLRDPNIRMVIPYHKSGLNPIVAHMNKIAEFTDYTNDQRTKGKDGKALSKDFDFSKALHDMGDKASPKAVADQYLKWCVANGYTARFAEFAAEDNYYKLLEDFTLYDKDGNYVPQREVRAVFPKADSAFGSMKDLIQEGLEEDAVIEGKRDSSLSSIVDEIQKTLPRMEAEIAETQVEQADRDLEADVKYSGRNMKLTEADVDEYMRTGVTKHTRDKKERMRESGKKPILTSSEETRAFISDVIAGKAAGEVRAFAKVGARLANAIKEKLSTLNVSGNYLELNADGLREAYKRHSLAKEHGDVPLSEADFERIPEYVDNFDGVLAVDTFKNRVEIHLYKKLSNSYVRILTVSSKERSSLQVTKLIGVSAEKFEAKYAKKIERDTGSPRGLTEKSEASNPSTKARLTAGALSNDIVHQDDADVKWSDRDTDSVSNRSLLANAFEGVAQNDIEKQKIQEYKGKIDLINAEEKKLQDLNKQIKDLSFASGPRDKDKIRKLQDEAQKTANRISIYDKQLLRLEASKPLQDILTREKKKAYQRAEQKGREALEAYREKATNAQKEMRDRYQESRKKGVENRHRTEMRHKIKNVVSELNQYLLNGNKDKRVMMPLKKAVAEALDAVNMDTVGAEERIAKLQEELMQAKTPEKIQEISRKIDHIREMGDNMSNRLKALKDAYREITESDDPLIANAHDDVIEAKLESVIEKVGNTPLRDMNLEQLGEVYDMYRMVLTTIRNANKAFKAAKSESIATLGDRVMKEVAQAGGRKKYNIAAVEAIKKFGWNNLKPVYAFEHIGSKTFAEIFRNVRAGEDVWATDITEAREFYLEKSKKYDFGSWKLDQQYAFTSTSGMDFRLNLEQIMSLYAYSKREQAADHLRRGGIVIDESTEITMKTKLGIKVKFNPTEATAYNISDETLADIISKLTPEQKQFVDEMQEYLSTTMGNKGNEVSLELYGVKLFKEKFYFPLKSASQFMAKAKEQQQGEVKIKNSGFSKETVKNASNPIVLTPFMNVWANHVNEMSMYHAFVLPMEDFYRVYNYRTPTDENLATKSVEMFIQNAYGKGATKYIDQLLKDLNGGARTDSTTGIINKGMGLFKKGAVFASASVVIQQPSAIARAAALVDLKHFIGPKVDHKRHKALWEEVKQYAPVAIIKEMGYFDTNMGKSTQDFMLGKEYSGVSEKMKALVTDSNYRDEVLSKAPALADEMAWCAIWEAVKRETKAKNPGMDTKSEAFLKKAGDRFTEVIVKTQVYDSVLSRSANMRSKDTGMKMATAFMAEPTTSINMIADALLQGKRGNRRYARAAIGSVIASQILNSILVSLVYAGRDDDEEKTYVEKYISNLTGEILDGLNPATYIPFIKDIVSIVQGYDVERSDMAVISDLWNAYQNLSNDDVSAYRKVEGFAGSICQIFGLPLKNIMKDVRAAFQTYNTIVNGEETTVRGVAYAVNEAITGKSTSNPDQLYKARLHGDEAHAARVESRYDDEKSANAAVRQAIKDRYLSGEINFSTATKQLMEYAGMKADEAYWLMDAWEHNKETGSDDGYSKYNDFYDAVQTGKNLKAVIKKYADNGVKNLTLSGQITEHFKPEYVEMSASERAGLKGYLINAYEQCGISREVATEKLRDWDFEAKNGFAYEDRRETYLNGEITASQLRNALMTFGGKTEEEADLQIQVYDWEAQGYEGATAAAVREYNEYCAASDVPKDVYMYIRRFSNDTENEVDEVTGKTIYYSAMKKVMAEIHAQTELTSDQKDAVARSLGWSEKNIKKYKLW